MTYQAVIYDKAGKKVGTHSFNAELYNEDVINTNLIHEYLLLQQSNGRVAIAHTKTRGEIHGSGKKLYRQKGTGNARVGDKKSPVRKGGGVAFGPRNERNFSKKMPQKMRRKAMRGLLTAKMKDGAVVGIRDLAFDVPKTKDAIGVLSAIKFADKRVLVIADADGVKKSFANVPKVRFVSASYVNPVDVAWAESLVMSEDALEYMNTLA